jgi:hypothetical protein
MAEVRDDDVDWDEYGSAALAAAAKQQAAQMSLEFGTRSNEMRRYFDNAFRKDLPNTLYAIAASRPDDPKTVCGQILAQKKHVDELPQMPKTKDPVLLTSGPRQFLRSTIHDVVATGIAHAFIEQPKRPLSELGLFVITSEGDGLVEMIRPYAENKGFKELKAACKPLFDKVRAKRQSQEDPRLTDQDRFNTLGELEDTIDLAQGREFFQLVGQHYFKGHRLDLYLDEDKFERFDFDGSFLWNYKETFRCLKNILQEKFEEGGGEHEMEVPVMTPEENGIEKIRRLGKGGQGAAWLANSEKYGQVALKIYSKDDPNASRIYELIDELELLQKLEKCTNIVMAYEIFQDQSSLYCVTEMMNGGDLVGLRQKCTEHDVTMDEKYFQKIFRQCLYGLEHLHRRANMHCDIKEPNIMMRNTDYAFPEIAIIDMGMARSAAGHGLGGGTPGYMPPETLRTNIWYPKGDIFSLGVTFFQLLADLVPDEKTGKLGMFQEGATSIKDVHNFVCSRVPPFHLIEESYHAAKP